MNKQNKHVFILSALLSRAFKQKHESAFSVVDQIVPLEHHSFPHDKQNWRMYWKTQGQRWRTEPEISKERQQELSHRRTLIPDLEQDTYPFQGMKLSRADIEWLLATHESGRGPVDWNDRFQREREGLDLRGTDLCYVNLSNLPLARLRGGFTQKEWDILEDEPRKRVGVLLKGADLRETHLEGAILRRACLEDASLSSAYLEAADLESSHLEHARLYNAHLEHTSLGWAHLEYAHLRGAILKHANLKSAYVQGVHLTNIHLCDEHHVGPQLVDIHWDQANLSVVNWSELEQLGEEYKARQKYDEQGILKSKQQQLIEYETAVRANRQLAVALQNQGLNEDASRFAYHAQTLQRKVLWMQRAVGKWFFSCLLALVAGYGYRMWRILAAYLLIISVCTVAYIVLGIYYPPHLSLLQAFLESVTAFHGRVFLEVFTSSAPQIWVTAIEAILGLLIEGVFIAMLTQRFFGK